MGKWDKGEKAANKESVTKSVPTMGNWCSAHDTSGSWCGSASSGYLSRVKFSGGRSHNMGHLARGVIIRDSTFGGRGKKQDWVESWLEL